MQDREAEIGSIDRFGNDRFKPDEQNGSILVSRILLVLSGQ